MTGRQLRDGRGGTFAGIAVRRPDGRLPAGKVLPDTPGRPDSPVRSGAGTPVPDAAVAGVRALPSGSGEPVRTGTTAAADALLEHKGERTPPVGARGCRGTPRIAHRSRPPGGARDTPGQRRGGAPHPLPGADDRLPAAPAPQDPPVRRGRRRARSAGRRTGASGWTVRPPGSAATRRTPAPAACPSSKPPAAEDTVRRPTHRAGEEIDDLRAL